MSDSTPSNPELITAVVKLSRIVVALRSAITDVITGDRESAIRNLGVTEPMFDELIKTLDKIYETK